MDYPPVWVLITTYKRLDTAIKTIQGVKENFLWPNLGFFLSDDGTGGDHIQRLRDEIGGTYAIETYDSNRKGVGHGMNVSFRRIWEMGADLVLRLEDDWFCDKPFDPTSCINLLMNNADMGMVRLGYLSYGLQAELISREEVLWWEFKNTGYTYTFAGHAALVHKRFHQHVGMYAEGLRPGDNELDFCARFNAKPHAPKIVWPADYGHIGPFKHIGSNSLADVPVG